MSESIMDSPWMRLLENNYKRPEGYEVDPLDDTYPELEKAEAELAAEIQAERRAKLEQSRKNPKEKSDETMLTMTGENTMTALEELLEMEKDRDERIKKIDDLLCRAVHEEGERLGTELLEKMKDGKFGYAEVLAHDAGYSTSYTAMCDLASDHQGNTYDRIQTLMEEEVWRYRLPCEIRNLVREWNFKYDMDEDTSAEDIDNLEREIGRIALEYVMFDIEEHETKKDKDYESL